MVCEMGAPPCYQPAWRATSTLRSSMAPCVSSSSSSSPGSARCRSLRLQKFQSNTTLAPKRNTFTSMSPWEFGAWCLRRAGPRCGHSYYMVSVSGYGREMSSVFDPLGTHEPALTAALGWTMGRSPALMSRVPPAPWPRRAWFGAHATATVYPNQYWLDRGSGQLILDTSMPSRTLGPAPVWRPPSQNNTTISSDRAGLEEPGRPFRSCRPPEPTPSQVGADTNSARVSTG